MADSTISGLPAAAALTGAEIVPVVQSSNDVRTTIQGISNLTQSQIGYNPKSVIKRLKFFHNADTASDLLPYGVIGAPYVQADNSLVVAITGYKSAGDGIIVRTNGTANTIENFLVYGHTTTNGFGKHDPFWSTGDTMQSMLYCSLLDKLPDASNNFEYRYGFFYNAYIFSGSVEGFGAAALDPFANAFITKDRAAAYFYVDKDSGYWRCKSGTGGVNTPQTTTTSVLAVLNQMVTLQIKINSDGSVSFWIDGALVATHATGKIADGKSLTEAAGTVHLAAVAVATKGLFISDIGFRHEQANQRTHFAFQ